MQLRVIETMRGDRLTISNEMAELRRMSEWLGSSGQACGMQKGAFEVRDSPQVARDSPMNAAVQGVADNRVPDRAEMHPNLMSPSGVDGDLRERHGPKRFGSDNSGHCFSAASRARRHLLAIVGIPPDGSINTAPGHHSSPDQRQVFLLGLAVVELTGELFVRGVMLGDDH